MLEEGIAREVVNRVQKFRKSGGLKVSDEVTMYYTVNPVDHTLNAIITKHLDYVQTSSKTPLRQKTSEIRITKTEVFEVKGAKLELNIVPGFPAGYSNGDAPSSSGGSAPALPWVNLELMGCAPAKYVKSTKGGMLLPHGEDMTISKLTNIIQDVFGLYEVPLELYYTPDKSAKVENLKFLSNNTVYAYRLNAAGSSGGSSSSSGFNCKFINVSKGGDTTSVLLENPAGDPISNIQDSLRNLKLGPLFKDEKKKSSVDIGQLASLAGQTLYV